MTSEEKITNIVRDMYKNGSNARSEKNGNPFALIKKAILLTKTKDIVTVGLYRKLDRETQKIIDEKESSSIRESIGFTKKVAKIIMEKKIENENDVFIHISSKGDAILNDIIKGNFDGMPYRKIKNVFDVKNIFIYQERQKTTYTK